MGGAFTLRVAVGGPVGMLWSCAVAGEEVTSCVGGFMLAVSSRRPCRASTVFGPAPCACRSRIVLSVNRSVNCNFFTDAAICLSVCCRSANSDRIKSANCWRFIWSCACSSRARHSSRPIHLIFTIMTYRRAGRLPGRRPPSQGCRTRTGCPYQFKQAFRLSVARPTESAEHRSLFLL